MKISFLNEITQIDETIFTWRNGKLGSLCDKRCNGEIRFFEYYIGENGMLQSKHIVFEPLTDKPLVCTGIAAYWIFHRNNGGGIRYMYDVYTKRHYEDFRFRFRNDANTWNWEDAEFVQSAQSVLKNFTFPVKIIDDLLA